MNPPCLLAIDCGTQSVRALLFDLLLAIDDELLAAQRIANQFANIFIIFDTINQCHDSTSYLISMFHTLFLLYLYFSCFV